MLAKKIRKVVWKLLQKQRYEHLHALNHCNRQTRCVRKDKNELIRGIKQKWTPELLWDQCISRLPASCLGKSLFNSYWSSTSWILKPIFTRLCMCQMIFWPCKLGIFDKFFKKHLTHKVSQRKFAICRAKGAQHSPVLSKFFIGVWI